MVALVVAIAVVAPAVAASGPMTVRFVDVGQGDATVFRGPCGDTGVLDVAEGAAARVLGALSALGSRRLRWIAVTHFDADHFGGVAELAAEPRVRIGMVYDRGTLSPPDKQIYRDYRAWLRTTDQPRRGVKLGTHFYLCPGKHAVDFEVVSVARHGVAANGIRVSSENDSGLCLKITYAAFKMVACGDAGKRVERAVASTIGKVDVVKIDHHGSSGSSDPLYIATLAPSVAVVSVGRNQWRHPRPAVMRAWRRVARVYRTAARDGRPVDGDVTATTDGTSTLTIRTTTRRRQPATFALAGTDHGSDGTPPATDETDGEALAIDAGALVAAGAAAAAARFLSRRRPRAPADGPPGDSATTIVAGAALVAIMVVVVVAATRLPDVGGTDVVAAAGAALGLCGAAFGAYCHVRQDARAQSAPSNVHRALTERLSEEL